jgi:hypothetical protein
MVFDVLEGLFLRFLFGFVVFFSLLLFVFLVLYSY